MIDVSNLVVKAVKECLKNDYPQFGVYSSYLDVIEKENAVTVLETNNYIDRSTMDSCGAEHHAFVVYDINVYTDKTGAGRELAKEVFTTINDTLVSMNFVRTFKSEIPNKDRMKFRITGRFEARVSEDMNIGGNVVNHVYRR